MNSNHPTKKTNRLEGWKPLPKSPTWLVKIGRRGPAFRYGLAILLVIAPLLLTFLVRRTGLTLNPTWPILICLLLISWYAGQGPCLLAAFLFALVIDFFFSPPTLVLKVNMAEINRMLVLMILAWITSARGRAEQRLIRRAQQQEAVARLAERALIEHDLQSLLDEAAALIAQTLNVEYTMVWDPMPAGLQLIARAGSGWNDGIIGKKIIDASAESVASYALTSKDPVIVKNLRRDKRFNQPPFLKEHKIVSSLGVTIPHKQSPVSVLVAYGSNRHMFSAEDVSFVQACAFCLAEAAERLRVQAEKEQLLISERKARAFAEDANRLKDEFLSTVSHELRTPLNSILGWVTLLRHKGLSPADSDRGLETIERNARMQSQIINDILDVSRIITGKLQLVFQPVELGGVLIAAAESMRPTAEAKGVELAVNLSTADAMVMGDGTRLQQVVWNLLSNAIRFTPAGGRVTLLLNRADSYYEIKVQDTGEGISLEFLPYVFDRFRQADSSSTRRYGGLGLGLSIVRHLVELHGGSVLAESNGIGCGAIFTIKLPVLMDRDKEENAIEISFAGADRKLDGLTSLSSLCVLVVDDDPDTQFLVKRILEEVGARVEIASSASEALDMVAARKLDVILSDIAMPVEDGYSFIRKVRAMAPDLNGNTPAVALTAFARPEDRLIAIQAGFHAHVSKPVDRAELLAVVDSLVNAWGKTNGQALGALRSDSLGPAAS